MGHLCSYVCLFDFYHICMFVCMHMCTCSVLVRGCSDGMDILISKKNSGNLRKPLSHGDGSKFIGYPDDFIHRRNDIFTTKKRGVIIFTTWEKENQHYQIRDKRGRGDIFY